MPYAPRWEYIYSMEPEKPYRRPKFLSAPMIYGNFPYPEDMIKAPVPWKEVEEGLAPGVGALLKPPSPRRLRHPKQLLGEADDDYNYNAKILPEEGDDLMRMRAMHAKRHEALKRSLRRAKEPGRLLEEEEEQAQMEAMMMENPDERKSQGKTFTSGWKTTSSAFASHARPGLTEGWPQCTSKTRKRVWAHRYAVRDQHLLREQRKLELQKRSRSCGPEGFFGTKTAEREGIAPGGAIASSTFAGGEGVVPWRKQGAIAALPAGLEGDRHPHESDPRWHHNWTRPASIVNQSLYGRKAEPPDVAVISHYLPHMVSSCNAPLKSRSLAHVSEVVKVAKDRSANSTFSDANRSTMDTTSRSRHTGGQWSVRTLHGHGWRSKAEPAI